MAACRQRRRGRAGWGPAAARGRRGVVGGTRDDGGGRRHLPAATAPLAARGRRGRRRGRAGRDRRLGVRIRRRERVAGGDAASAGTAGHHCRHPAGHPVGLGGGGAAGAGAAAVRGVGGQRRAPAVRRRPARHPRPPPPGDRAQERAGGATCPDRPGAGRHGDAGGAAAVHRRAAGHPRGRAGLPPHVPGRGDRQRHPGAGRGRHRRPDAAGWRYRQRTALEDQPAPAGAGDAGGHDQRAPAQPGTARRGGLPRDCRYGAAANGQRRRWRPVRRRLGQRAARAGRAAGGGRRHADLGAERRPLRRRGIAAVRAGGEAG
jgi:hypothetical protein